MNRTVNPYTRKIDKEYNRLLFKQAIVTTDKDGNQSFTINPSDVQDAKDYLLSAMYSMSQSEVENLGIREYEELNRHLDKVISDEKNGSIAGDSAKVGKSN